MNLSRNAIRIINCKKLLMIFLIISTVSTNSIQSQNTLTTISPEWFQQETTIKYEQLNEVLKLAKYKGHSKKRDSIQKRQLAIQDSIINSQRDIINRYENKVIPSLKEQVRLFKSQLSSQEDLNAIRDEKWDLKLKEQKSKRLGLSLFAGYGYAEESFMPMVGAGVSYTFIRF